MSATASIGAPTPTIRGFSRSNLDDVRRALAAKVLTSADHRAPATSYGTPGRSARSNRKKAVYPGN